MITCDACGATNEDTAQFCGVCGEYLWDRTSPERPTDVSEHRETTDRQATSTTDAEPRRATLASDGGRATLASDGGRATLASDGGRGDPTATTDARPSTSDVPPRRSTSDVLPRQPDSGPDATGDDRHPRPVQPGPPQPVLPIDPKPAPVPPDDARPHPPKPRLVCPKPACGADNDPGRRFCWRCGETLVAAPAAPVPNRTWWQRWWDRLRRRTPRRRSPRDERAAAAARRTLLIVLALCLVGVLAVVGPPLVRRGVEAVRDRTQDPTPLVPTSVVASSEAPEAGAARLTDGANNRYWAPNGKAVDSWVESRFTEPVRLLTVVITPGVSPRRQAYLAAGRPRGLTVITVDADGKQRKTDIELRDEPGEQHFDVPASDVVRIRLVVRSTYGPGLIPSVAIGEAEFFGRR
ncbi:hypothetical protein GA0074695_2972 [Micromonospora viridifaciens]|uniref:Zinc-ribbon domain-containing protein n=1 Tax=Micromonospora viridifaciens TaxID=1881 RepID=A0A1C4X386_MICVI|nr:zinc ribbon domain-containing protein [Micromonospora viridifaciens]SCF02919.1 hypothetical protein GA0074695_2972 [Micromonospora viridifaciens]